MNRSILMPAHSAEKGQVGEEKAAAWLQARGWGIIARNYRTRAGEIDIIAESGETLAFIEVKSWGVCSFADLGDSVDRRKMKRILETSKIFLSRNRQYECALLRYDILFVPESGAVIHLESAFTE